MFAAVNIFKVSHNYPFFVITVNFLQSPPSPLLSVPVIAKNNKNSMKGSGGMIANTFSRDLINRSFDSIFYCLRSQSYQRYDKLTSLRTMDIRGYRTLRRVKQTEAPTSIFSSWGLCLLFRARRNKLALACLILSSNL